MLVACTDEGVRASDEVGETGDAPLHPLPGGEACALNWYAIDGEAIDSPGDQAGGFEAMGEPFAFDEALSVEGAAAGAPAVEARGAGLPAALADMGFEAFAARYAEPRGERWIFAGDLSFSDARLRELHRQLQAEARRQQGRAGEGQTTRATTHAPDGVDAVWSGHRKLALTWCLGPVMPSVADFPEQHDANVARLSALMEEASRAWERAGDLNFIHLRELDSPDAQAPQTCKPGEQGVFFRVRTGSECTGPCGGLTLEDLLPQYEFEASPFATKRELIIGLQQLSASEIRTRETLHHELGHVIGRVHEHLRWDQEDEAEACRAGGLDPWRELTPPDANSIMGYDYCAGMAANQPRLSAYDRLGAYYAYSWARRRPWPGEAAANLAYGGSARRGIAWQRPRSASLEVWTVAGGPGEAITFDREERCVDGSAPPCSADFDPRGRLRPTAARLEGSAKDVDLLIHGPGPGLVDLLALDQGQGQGFAATSLALDDYLLPVVGRFRQGASEQVLLHRPGPQGDALMVVEDGEASFLGMDFAGYGYPLVGHYRGPSAPGEDIVWWRPHDNSFFVWSWLASGEFEAFKVGPSDAGLLGISAGQEHVPVLGDFDGDLRTDIFWYGPGEVKDVMWWSLGNMNSVIFEAASTQLQGEFRPFAADFDGNGVTDILWFSSHDEAANTNSRIWFFSEERTFLARPFSTHRDYSPYVDDFDDDGCADILWFRPDALDGLSPLWRCLPGEKDFTCDEPVAHPAEAYPVGWGGAY
ncbi:FG-GAP-like repeat-containing protein [Pseudenhygromyxa sp. WMMC2535]|uniref:FG-GAP-like repeat-containing protein n=1 Tax=Pseudenhygromyxa sp. WMMC2535 TaxID=2712867 RepID=UPI001557242E|nr:FG-GAP-like repeat-containing protein [Pseudenhygromyxa sp. WMMC2535]